MAVKQLIERVELDSSAASITFSSIPQTFAHLVLLISTRNDRGTTNDQVALSLNGSTANRSSVFLGGNGSATFSETRTNGFVGFDVGNTATANTFSNGQIYFSNYTASQAKSVSSDVVGENNASSANQTITAFLWNDTSAITSINLSPVDGTVYLANSTFSLYGITRGGDGTVTTA